MEETEAHKGPGLGMHEWELEQGKLVNTQHPPGGFCISSRTPQWCHCIYPLPIVDNAGNLSVVSL